MRVLHLTAEFPPFIFGGLGTAVGGLAMASVRAGIEVKVLLVGGEWFWSYGGRVASSLVPHPLPTPGLEILPVGEHEARAAAVRLARQWHPEILHLHPVELWPIAQAIRQETGMPVVYTAHSLNSAEYEMGGAPPSA